MSRRTNRAIKRGLKAGGFYDTRGFYKDVRNAFKFENNSNKENIREFEPIELNPKTKKALPWIILLIILIIILIFNIDNFKNAYLKKQGTKLLKKEINDILKTYEFKDFEIKYIENDKDTKIICKYDIDVYYDDFDKIENKTKYEIFDTLEHHQIDKEPYCYVKEVHIYSNNDFYDKSLLSIYKNEEEIYNSYREEKKSTATATYDYNKDDNWQNYKEVTKNAYGCYPSKPDYVCHKEKNPVTREIQKVCRCMKTYD